MPKWLLMWTIVVVVIVVVHHRWNRRRRPLVLPVPPRRRTPPPPPEEAGPPAPPVPPPHRAVERQLATGVRDVEVTFDIEAHLMAMAEEMNALLVRSAWTPAQQALAARYSGAMSRCWCPRHAPYLPDLQVGAIWSGKEHA